MSVRAFPTTISIGRWNDRLALAVGAALAVFAVGCGSGAGTEGKGAGSSPITASAGPAKPEAPPGVKATGRKVDTTSRRQHQKSMK
jgi:hypothetical protein